MSILKKEKNNFDALSLNSETGINHSSSTNTNNTHKLTSTVRISEVILSTEYSSTLEKKDEIHCQNNWRKRRLIGIVLTLLSALLFTCQNFLIKELIVHYDYSAFEQLLLKGYIFILAAFGGIKYQNLSFSSLSLKEFDFLKILSAIGVITSICMIISLGFLTVANATIILFLFPVYIPFLMRLLCGNQIMKWDYVSILVSLIGIILILKPSFIFTSQEEENEKSFGYYLSIFLMIVCGLVISYQIALTRKEKSVVNSFLIIFVMGILCVITAIIALFIQEKKTKFSLIGVILIGLAQLLNFVGRLAEYYSVKFEEAALVGIIRYSQILFSYIIGSIFYSFEFDYFEFGGAMLIVVSSLAISIYKLRSR